MKNLDNSLRIVLENDYNVKPLDKAILSALMSDDVDLFTEATDIEDVETTYHPDGITLSEGAEQNIFSAIVTRQDRLTRTLKAFTKSLNDSLKGTGLVAGANAVEGIGKLQGRVIGDAIVSKPRKSGLVAVLTTQIPISDGQSVFILFYAPDDDPLTIKEKDTLIAFKFMLNKKDITHVVAPHQGRDISLKQTTQSLSNVIEKNSAQFQERQKTNAANKAKLEDLQSKTEQSEANTSLLVDRVSRGEIELDGLINAESEVNESLQKQTSLTNKLKEKLERLKATAAKEVETSEVPAPSSIQESEAQAEHENTIADQHIQETPVDGAYFNNAHTTSELIAVWDGMKKGDVVTNYLGREMGVVKKKPTKAQNALTLVDSDGYEARIDSNKILGFDVKVARKASDETLQKWDENLKQERETKAGVKVEGDTFIHDDVKYTISHIDLANQTADIERDIITYATHASQLEENFGIKVAGLNADPIESAEPEASPTSVEEFLAQSDAIAVAEDEKASRVLELITTEAERLDMSVATELSNDFEGDYGLLLRVTVSKGEESVVFQITTNGKAAMFTLAGERIESIGGESVFKPYSNWESTQKERLQAFNKSLNKELTDEDKSKYKDDVEALAKQMLSEWESNSSTDNRPTLSDEFKAQLFELINRFDEEQLGQFDIEGVRMARMASFLDTAIFELQNGGFFDPSINLYKEPEKMDNQEELQPEDVDQTPTYSEEDESQDIDAIEGNNINPEDETQELPEPEPVDTQQVDTEETEDLGYSPAVLKVMTEISEMNARRDRMKSANRAAQKYTRAMNKDGANQEAALATLIKEFEELNFSEALAREVAREPSYSGKYVAFEAYELTNLGARIKSREEKIKTLQEKEAAQEEGGQEYNLEIDGFNVTVSVDYDDDRIRLSFDDLTSAPTTNDAEYPYIQNIKRGANWSRANQAWQRKITDSSKYAFATGLGFKKLERAS